VIESPGMTRKQFGDDNRKKDYPRDRAMLAAPGAAVTSSSA
jgi:hypothetical protein